jgi:peptidoglycan/xylan/chitin deacetylase (PgdA/CDA1 family)
MAKTARKTRKPAPRRSRSTTLVPNYAARAGKEIWLTFDDGPHPKQTDRVLKTLDKFGIKATFFVVGENADKQKQLVKKAYDAGHRIGNHSFTHPDLTKLSDAEVRSEIARTHDIISDYLGRDWIFRPPYGAHNARVDKVVAALGYRLVLWNVDTLDWSADYQPDKWVQHGIDQIRARDQSRVLNHDIHETTADNLEMFIDRIKQLGGVTFKSPSTL